MIQRSTGKYALLALPVDCGAAAAQAHHSAAGYALDRVQVFTGVVERIYPGAGHLEIFFRPLSEERSDYLRDSEGKAVIWSAELARAPMAAAEGISVGSYPPNTVFSIGLNPKRNGDPAGLRVPNSALFRCAERTLPAPGRQCDSVSGHVVSGLGTLPTATEDRGQQEVSGR